MRISHEIQVIAKKAVFAETMFSCTVFMMGEIQWNT